MLAHPEDFKNLKNKIREIVQEFMECLELDDSEVCNLAEDMVDHVISHVDELEDN